MARQATQGSKWPRGGLPAVSLESPSRYEVSFIANGQNIPEDCPRDIPSMAKTILRIAAVACLAIWVVTWLAFLLMRFSPLDIRHIPAIGIIMLAAFAVALATPILATGLAAAALVRHPRTRRDSLILGFAITALLGQVFLFLITRWL